MFNLPTILIALESLIIVWLFFSLQKVTSDLSRLKTKENLLKDADYQRRKAEKILENAKEKYAQVISQSYKKAQQVIADAKVFNEETKEKVLGELGKSIQNITSEIKNETLEEVRDFGQELKEEVKVQEEASQKVIADKYDQVNAEIEQYRKNKVTEIDKSAVKAVEEVTKNILTKSLDLSGHEEFILEALENAKKNLH